MSGHVSIGRTLITLFGELDPYILKTLTTLSNSLLCDGKSNLVFGPAHLCGSFCVESD